MPQMQVRSNFDKHPDSTGAGNAFLKGLSAACDNARINLDAIDGSYYRKRDSRSSYLAAGLCQLHGEYYLPMMSEQTW
jgi:hypothetical protein